MDNPDLAAVIGGMKSANDMSKLALGGLSPSAGSPRGGPPPADPLLPLFRQTQLQMQSLATMLEKQGDNPHSLDVQEMGLKLQRMSQDRANAIAKAGVPQQSADAQNNALNAAFPNINGGGNV